jgi:hypothetical protein
MNNLKMELVDVKGDLRAFGKNEVVRELIRKSHEETKRAIQRPTPDAQRRY